MFKAGKTLKGPKETHEQYGVAMLTQAAIAQSNPVLGVCFFLFSREKPFEFRNCDSGRITQLEGPGEHCEKNKTESNLKYQIHNFEKTIVLKKVFKVFPRNSSQNLCINRDKQ
ncbi:uncharacterized protein LOC128294102 [Gossypium arboreum]|uniref:uncharacterized protein LOC128294102 n=1 Tax=Gossypium arboreum TaxID=29729 RepID=UPI0022F1AC2E|nr:uncharacterized protein LOC128294102 [Gossypium arboreum]